MNVELSVSPPKVCLPVEEGGSGPRPINGALRSHESTLPHRDHRAHCCAKRTHRYTDHRTCDVCINRPHLLAMRLKMPETFSLYV